MLEVLKISKTIKQHILYVANSIFGIIPYNHSLNSTFDACPEVFFVEGLKTEKKEGRQTMARLRFLWRLEVSSKRQVLDLYLKTRQKPSLNWKNEIITMR